MVGTGDINSSIREQEIENDNSVLFESRISCVEIPDPNFSLWHRSDFIDQLCAILAIL